MAISDETFQPSPACLEAAATNPVLRGALDRIESLQGRLPASGEDSPHPPYTYVRAQLGVLCNAAEHFDDTNLTLYRETPAPQPSTVDTDTQEIPIALQNPVSDLIKLIVKSVARVTRRSREVAA